VKEDDMDQDDGARSNRVFDILRVTAIWTSVLLLPPFFILAIAPMLLLLIPVAIVAIPFIIPAMFPGSWTAFADDRQRASLRPAARPALVLR
jgi:hypothetical protein